MIVLLHYLKVLCLFIMFVMIFFIHFTLKKVDNNFIIWSFLSQRQTNPNLILPFCPLLNGHFFLPEKPSVQAQPALVYKILHLFWPFPELYYHMHMVKGFEKHLRNIHTHQLIRKGIDRNGQSHIG